MDMSDSDPPSDGDTPDGFDAPSDAGPLADRDTVTEVIRARGHENVTAEHASTFEFTTDDWLTPAGDCILAVDADRTPRDFDPAFRAACQDSEATIVATITVESADDSVENDTHSVRIVGRGDPELTLLDDRSMVGRTSGYTDDERTILVDADAAAADLDRDLVDALSDGGASVRLRLDVEP